MNGLWREAEWDAKFNIWNSMTHYRNLKINS